MLSNPIEPRCRIQGLIQVFNDVLRMFEPDAEPDRFGAYTCPTLFVWSHLPVGGRGGMAAKRASVTDIDQPFDQLKGVIESLGRIQAALHTESKQRRRPPIEVLAGKLMIRTLWKADIVDPSDPWITPQKISDLARVFDVTLHAQRHGLNALQDEEGTHRREHRSHRALVNTAGARDEGLGAEPVGVNQTVVGIVGFAKHREP